MKHRQGAASTLPLKPFSAQQYMIGTVLFARSLAGHQLDSLYFTVPLFLVGHLIKLSFKSSDHASPQWGPACSLEQQAASWVAGWAAGRRRFNGGSGRLGGGCRRLCDWQKSRGPVPPLIYLQMLQSSYNVTQCPAIHSRLGL